MAVSPLDYRYKTEMSRIFDEESKYKSWMEVWVALARAEAQAGMIPKQAPKAIEAGAKKVKVERIWKIEEEIHHDLMAAVKALAEKSGKYGGYVHLGATSYDIEDTATALQFREGFGLLEERLERLMGLLKDLAMKHAKTVCVGRTHGQHAIPTTYGMKFALYYADAQRNLERLRAARDRISVGKLRGAVGTRAALGRKGKRIEDDMLLRLKLRPAKATTQVIQRDRHAESMFTLACIAAAIEKMAKEVRNLSRPEMGELAESFGKKQVGSSTMPQKRNPHRSERLCSLARLVRANVQAALENIPLEHERDLTNSANERFIFPESFIVTDYMLVESIKVLKGLRFFPENIRKNLELSRGGILAERLMISLVEKGLGRQEAHEEVRSLAHSAFEKKTSLRKELEKSKLAKKFSRKELDHLFDPATYLGDAEEIVKAAIQ